MDSLSLSLSLPICKMRVIKMGLIQVKNGNTLRTRGGKSYAEKGRDPPHPPLCPLEGLDIGDT